MADCTYTVDDLVASGDSLYGPRVCNQPFIDWAWKTYNFDKDWWGDGWGYDDCCNIRKPLCRTFAAIWALTYSSERVWTSDHGENMLEWAGRWVAEQMSNYDLRARCGDKVATTYGAGCTEYRHSVKWDCTQYKDEGYRKCRSWPWWASWLCYAWYWVSNIVCVAWGYVASWVCAAAVFVFGSKHVDLQNDQFFYANTAVPFRASVLVHESRHISGKTHRGTFPSLPGSAYPAGKTGADESWEWNGAWRWQAVWLAWYSARATNSTPTLRAKARTDANVIMVGAFENPPGFTF
jgi:hypothetical protein